MNSLKTIGQDYLKNQHQDLKILSIPSKILTSKTQLLLLGFLFSLILIPQVSFSEVFVPSDEFVGYFDSNGIYTVIGNVKNKNNYAVIPTISVSIKNNSEIFSKTITHVPLSAGTEIPFKIKFPNVLNDPKLLPVELSFERTIKDKIPITVLYDETLVKYDDGHLTGRIQNVGDKTIYNPKIFAVIHGYERVLDVAQNMEFIEKIEPREIMDFSMYPDPSITDDVFYYSCFAPSDNTVVSMYAERNQKKFYFRYDGGSWYYDAQFNKDGTKLSMKTQTSFNLETYANFEFPHAMEDEKFKVFLNGEPKEFIQSTDENGNWHVAFNVHPYETGNILITGFDEGWDPGEKILIPDWIKNNAKSWSENNLDDDIFVKGIKFMIQQDILKISTTDNIENEKTFIPQWIKISAGWWFEGTINDNTFIQGIQFLIKEGILQISS